MCDVIQQFVLGDKAFLEKDGVLHFGVISDWQPYGEDYHEITTFMYKLALENSREIMCLQEELMFLNLDELVNL